ncbi:hypothetical protein BK123_14850, partial [Paenibacillus lautus]
VLAQNHSKKCGGNSDGRNDSYMERLLGPPARSKIFWDTPFNVCALNRSPGQCQKCIRFRSKFSTFLFFQLSKITSNTRPDAGIEP